MKEKDIDVVITCKAKLHEHGNKLTLILPDLAGEVKLEWE